MTPHSAVLSRSTGGAALGVRTAGNHERQETERTVVFISKGTPEDDDFVLWLAPRLEAHGYKIFADILTLEPGDRWRREITNTLQTKAAKMLLCCRDVTLAKAGVQEEIGIAEDLVKELRDPRFIIPLRMEKFKKLFGIGELQYINFENRWADGLRELLDTLAEQNVPCDPSRIEINPNWENYKKRNAIAIEDAPERLTSNWLRVAEVPDTIRYFQPTGAIDHQALHHACKALRYPAEVHLRGLFAFCDLAEINEAFQEVGKFALAGEFPVMEFIANGAESPSIRSREASNLIVSTFGQAWESFCREKKLYEYHWSQQSGFHVTDEHLPVGKKLKWGTQGENRSSMLRNKAQGKIWQFGVTALPAFWPFPHFKLKSRVLFAESEEDKAGAVFEDKKLQHRYRRRVCKGWRNKQWHGRLMAFMELLAADQASVKLPLAAGAFVRLEATPILFTSPVTTVLPDVLADEDEEYDDATLTDTLSEEED
jgi:hypothetical protein